MQRKVTQSHQWKQQTEVVTASDSDTDEETRKIVGHVRRSQKEIVEGGATVTRVVGTELVEQEPLVEEYMSEEIEQQVVRKPRRRATKQVIREVDATSSEEEVIVQKRAPRRKSRVVQTVKARSPKRRVEYVEESESEEEVVQMRRPVVKQRVIQQPAKVQKIVVEEPQQKVTKAKKETIRVPVQTTKTESYEEEVELETEEDRRMAKELETRLNIRNQDLVAKQAEIQQLAQLLEAKRKEHQQCEHEISQCSHALHEHSLKPKKQMVTKTRTVPHTDYVEKKVRKVTTETPVAVENWQDIAKSQVSVKQSASPMRSSVTHARKSTVMPARSSYVTTQFEEPVVETRVVRKSSSPSRKSRVVRSSNVNDALYGGSSYTVTGGAKTYTSTLPGAVYSSSSTGASQVFGSPVRTSTVRKSTTSGWNKY